MKRGYDGKANHADFKDGDQVWLYIPQRTNGQSPNLQSPWEGPYTVVSRLSDETYRIKRGRRRKSKTGHVKRLWRNHGRSRYTWDGGEGQQINEEERQTQEDDEGCQGLDRNGDRP